MDVFPIPPAPMRAMGSSFWAISTTLSISSSRPKQALGAGGGDSPTPTLRNRKIVSFQWLKPLTWYESGTISISLVVNGKLRLPIDVGRQQIPDLRTRDDEGPKVSYDYSLTAPSEGETVSGVQVGPTERTLKI